MLHHNRINLLVGIDLIGHFHIFFGPGCIQFVFYLLRILKLFMVIFQGTNTHFQRFAKLVGDGIDHVLRIGRNAAFSGWVRGYK